MTTIAIEVRPSSPADNLSPDQSLDLEDESSVACSVEGEEEEEEEDLEVKIARMRRRRLYDIENRKSAQKRMDDSFTESTANSSTSLFSWMDGSMKDNSMKDNSLKDSSHSRHTRRIMPQAYKHDEDDFLYWNAIRRRPEDGIERVHVYHQKRLSLEDDSSHTSTVSFWNQWRRTRTARCQERAARVRYTQDDVHRLVYGRTRTAAAADGQSSAATTSSSREFHKLQKTLRQQGAVTNLLLEQMLSVVLQQEKKHHEQHQQEKQQQTLEAVSWSRTSPSSMGLDKNPEVGIVTGQSQKRLDMPWGAG